MNDLFLKNKDYRYLDWSKIRSSSGTAGSFLKATEVKKGNKIYYKLSNYNSVQGIVGHECVNEIIASRLMDVLEIDHLSYRLLYGRVQIDDVEYETYFCASDSFRKPGERKITFEDYFQLMRKKNETPIEFVRRNHWGAQVEQMLLLDFLILNRDRHGANIELIRGKDGKVRMAPLFDQGISFLFQCRNIDEVKTVNVMEDKKVQSFFGGNSTFQNLEFLPKEKITRPLKEEHREYLFNGLENILPEEFYDKIWEMIWERWKYYENMFCV